MRSRLVLSLFVLCLSQAVAQMDWQQNEFNPIIRNYFDSKSQCMYRPCVMYHNNSYHMWYSKINSEFEQMMGYARSLDGIQWTLIDAKALLPSKDLNRFDTYHAGQGWVLVEQDTFKMWYWGHGLNMGSIGMAWSLDGKEWYKVAGDRTGGSVYDRQADGSNCLGLLSPCVVKIDSVYHMWYARHISAPSTCVIAYARSRDGLHWQNIAGVETNGAVLDWGKNSCFDQVSVAYPCVVNTKAGLFMWYSGIDGNGAVRVGLARSVDGLHWTKIAGQADKGACLNCASSPCVLFANDIFKMWYGINNKDVINYATSRFTTLVRVLKTRHHKMFTMGQNFPNPFNAVTHIPYTLDTTSRVRLFLYDLRGRLLQTLVNSTQPAGGYRVNITGENLCSGIYYCVLRVNAIEKKRRLLLIK